MSRVRHRKTINPFRFQRDIQRPDWSALLASPDQPIEVDLGFGRGEFILEQAQRRPDTFIVGLELRDYLIEKVQAQIDEQGLPNLYVMAANVKEHLPLLFDPGRLSRVYIHFPDPWTKRKKHHKRRMVDAQLVDTLYALLRPGGEVHLMTDKHEVGHEMRALFEAHPGFENAHGPDQFAPTSTTGVRTREEEYYLGRGDQIYRLQYVRDCKRATQSGTE
jgi:tRNA (guanine-N7-)-methyltransferase